MQSAASNPGAGDSFGGKEVRSRDYPESSDEGEGNGRECGSRPEEEVGRWRRARG